MRTANPALRPEHFAVPAAPAADVMTIPGTVGKTAVLLVCCLATALFTWSKFGDAIVPGQGLADGFAAVRWWLIGGAVTGLILAIVTCVKPTWSPITAPLYAGAEGLFLGSISAMFNASYPGIVFQAVGLTFGVLAALLLAYTSRLIKPTENFKLGVTAATGGILLLYVVSFALSFFGMSVPFIHSSGLFGIGFSVFVVIIAALNLVLDFDFIESGAERGAPKYLEWYGAFGLMVTLVWLYLEILRLLAKLQSRD